MNNSVRFRLIETLGSPDVYLAKVEDPTNADGDARSSVVLKLTSISGLFEEIRAQVRRGAETLDALGHPNIVFCRDLVRFAQRYALVTDHIPGADLEHVLAALELVGERMPARVSLSVGGGIFAAIAAACETNDAGGRARPFVHGALRAKCIYLTLRGGVKIADYNRPQNERTDSIRIRELHLAPERMRGEKESVASDIYAAASLTVELLAGQSMSAQLMPDLHASAIEQQLRPLYSRYVDYREMITALDLLARALGMKQSDRPAASVLQQALDRAAIALDGETLPSFAGRFLPELDVILGRMSAPAAGIVGAGAAQIVTTKTARLSRSYLVLFVVALFTAGMCSAVLSWALTGPIRTLWLGG